MPENEVVLVRHGETEWSSSGRHTSFTDVPLTDARLRAGPRGRDRGSRWKFALVLTQPAMRAAETSAFAGLGRQGGGHRRPAGVGLRRLRGSHDRRIRKEVPGWTIFSNDPPGGETSVQVAARADRVSRAPRRPTARSRSSRTATSCACSARGWVGSPSSGGALLALDTATLSVLGYEREQRVIRVWNS